MFALARENRTTDALIFGKYIIFTFETRNMHGLGATYILRSLKSATLGALSAFSVPKCPSFRIVHQKRFAQRMPIRACSTASLYPQEIA